jgi:PLP dependent protein
MREKIAQNWGALQKEIAACGGAQPVTVVAVTKGRTAGEIAAVIAAGATNIGENRWQDAQEKLADLAARGLKARKHFIGHLQTNKVREVVAHFDMIQSVDSVHLAEKIDAECAKIGKVMPVLIEVNTSDEAQKHGIGLDDAEELVAAVAKLPHLKLEGLMTVAIESPDEARVRVCFRLLRGLYEDLRKRGYPLSVLSMGMSADFKWAIAEGATMVRVGRRIFNNA